MISYLFTFTCVIMTFCLSEPLLSFIGIFATSSDSNIIERIHPVLIFTLISFVVSFIFGHADHHNRKITAYYANVAVGIWWMLYAYFINGHPATIPLVSYVGPFFLLILLVKTSREQQRRIATFVHMFMVLNAIVALGEFILQVRLLPVVSVATSGEVARVNALIGHPLTNATITGSYILAVFSNLRFYTNLIYPSFSIAICILSMAAYSGRAATAALLLFLIYLFLKGDWGKSYDKKWQCWRFAFVACVIILLVSLILFAFDIGLFDRFISRFQNDYGSAQTRAVALDTIRLSSLEKLIFGREDKFIVFRDYFGRIAVMGPEIFWLNLLFYNGFIVVLPVFIIFIFGMNQLRREVSGSVNIVILYFLICISGSIGLGGKSQLLGMFFVIILSVCNNGEQILNCKKFPR